MWKWEAEDAKAVIVMVHGASEHHGRYKWLIEMWRAENLHVVMGDLPGQGTSTRKRGHINSFDEYIEVISEWVQEAKKYNLPVFLLGHSMGGLAVIRTMQEKQLDVSSVLLSSPCLGLIKPPPLGLEILSRGLNYVAPGMLFSSHLEVGIATRNNEVKERDENDSLYVRKVSVRWYRELVKAMKIAFLKTKSYPNVPTLLMQGGEDKVVNKEMVKNWFDQVKVHEKMYKEWEGLYHEIFNEPERDTVFRTAIYFVNLHLTNLKK